ncbi:MAG: hypothetical protein KW806_00315 [Candidatus Yanofskybacteria bacterium]|nr:hypothetical protein [Candidatus Yanofskybacteria bacterium]
MRTFIRTSALFLILGLLFSMPASADTAGQQVTFNVNNQFDQNNRSSLTATLRYAGSKSYMYVDDSYWQGLSQFGQSQLLAGIQSLAQEFDNRIYPTSTAFWGSENNPGVDNDSHITILLEEMKSGYGGYFDNLHSYPRSQAPDSNQREMIFISARAIGGGSENEFLTHEFQHLVAHNQKELLRKATDPVWINEMRSEYAATLLGYNDPFLNSNLDRRTRTFLQNPSDGLTDWPNESRDYAVVNVFADYLAGRYGAKIFSDSLKSNATGIASLNTFWSANGYSERFTNVFADWMVATFLNKPGDIRFGYNNKLKTLHVLPQFTDSIAAGGSSATSLSLKPWQPMWFSYTSLQSDQAVKLEITSSAPLLLPYVVFYTDGSQDIITPTEFTGTKTLYARTNGKQIQRVVVAASPVGSLPEVSNETSQQVSVRVSLVNDSAVLEPTPTLIPSVQPNALVNGALIKRRGFETEVYVIEGKYKRFLRSEIIALYGHLKNVQPLEVDDAVFNSYTTANYVRDVNQEKVYAIWPDGTKHWLRMTGEYFFQSGRDWGSIFVINDLEFNSYRTGPDITR